jgi:hypothetical protein
MKYVSASFPRSQSVKAAFFSIEITATRPESKVGGDTVEADYEIENSGSASGTQDIQLFVDDSLEQTDSDVTVSDADSTTGTLTWDSVPSDVGEFELRVESEDGSDTETITMEEP